MPEVKRNAQGQVMYEPDGPVLAAFLMDNARVSVCQGPVGSGKSKACNMKLYRLAMQQKPNRSNVRKTRWAVVRNTYGELKNTTIRTWLDTFPEEMYGRFKWSPPYHHVIRVANVEIEVDFLAMDREDEIKKLRSGEYTGFYVNEIQYIHKAVFDEMTSRTGRYPPVKDGGATWHGIIADANAPEEDHWLAIMTNQVEMPRGMSEEEVKSLTWPHQWKHFMQPSGMLEDRDHEGRVIGYRVNPHAENLKWLPENYYSEMIRGKTRGWIDSHVMNRVTVELDGNPVWKNFTAEAHLAAEVLKPMPNSEIHVGLDFGRQPAAILGQEVDGRVIVIDEVIGQDESAAVFAPKVKAHLSQHYPGMTIRFHGDPKGQDKPQSDERTAYDVWASYGMQVKPAPVKGNNIKTRIDAVDYLLTQTVGGKAKFLLSPICRTLRMACQGKYHYAKNDMNKVEPVKDRFSNPADALQYMVLGMGYGRTMAGFVAAAAARPVVNQRRFGVGRRVF